MGNLVLTLSGPSRRELTPPGGARDLLPGEYAYTLTDEIKSQLPPGRYRFVLRARGTAGGVVARGVRELPGRMTQAHALRQARLPPVRGGPRGGRAVRAERPFELEEVDITRDPGAGGRATASGSPSSRSTATRCSSFVIERSELERCLASMAP